MTWAGVWKAVSAREPAPQALFSKPGAGLVVGLGVCLAVAWALGAMIMALGRAPVRAAFRTRGAPTRPA